jgi:hypothetical protein
MNSICLPEIKLLGFGVYNINQELIDTNFLAMQNLVQKFEEKRHLINNFNKPRKTYLCGTRFSKEYKINRLLGKHYQFYGEEVSNFDNNNNEFEQLVIPSQEYLIFETKTGNISEVVVKKWYEIWLSEEISKKRKYIVDFELYEENIDINKANAKIYIGIN